MGNFSQSRFIQRLAKESHFGLHDLSNRGKALREAQMIGRGSRGLASSNIRADEAASILISAMSGASAAESPAVVRRIGNWESRTGAEIQTEFEKIVLDAEKANNTYEFDSGLNFGGSLAEIFDDPDIAAGVEYCEVDHVNGWAVIRRTDGVEQIFSEGGAIKDSEKLVSAGVRVAIHGRVLLLLSTALDNAKHPLTEARIEYMREVFKIAGEKGNAAADQYMKDHPFEEQE